MTEREEAAKAWLNRNYQVALEVNAIQRRLDKMQSDIEKCTKPIKLREIMEGHSGNSQEDKMADYIDLSEDLAKRLIYLMSLDAKTMKVIEQVESSTLRTILIERYVNRLSWRKIADIIHAGEGGWLFELHRQALDAVLPYIPEEAKK